MRVPSTAVPIQNNLLASLPATVRERLLSLMELCSLPRGKVLYESGESISHVYFPTDAIVSLLYVTEEGGSTEISLVGNDGVVGISRFLGGNSSHTRAVVQIAGSAYRLPAQAVMAEFDRHTELMLLTLRYTQALMTQMAQTAVCNRHHSLEQQLCRLLLLLLDRLPSNELILTQELISNMLGVRREGVTEAAGKLQRLGMIEYSRGHIRVLDRERLELLSCECYSAVKYETDRLLAPQRRSPAPPFLSNTKLRSVSSTSAFQRR